MKKQIGLFLLCLSGITLFGMDPSTVDSKAAQLLGEQFYVDFVKQAFRSNQDQTNKINGQNDLIESFQKEKQAKQAVIDKQKEVIKALKNEVKKLKLEKRDKRKNLRRSLRIKKFFAQRTLKKQQGWKKWVNK